MPVLKHFTLVDRRGNVLKKSVDVNGLIIPVWGNPALNFVIAHQSSFASHLFYVTEN